MQDEIAYTLFLIFSVVAGIYIQQLSSSHQRKIISGLIGFCSSVFFCKSDFLYALLTIVICTLICSSDNHIIRSYRRGFAFVGAFGFLTLFRVSHAIGLPAPCALANAIQLVLTLKVVGLGGEVTDSQLREDNRRKHSALNSLQKGGSHFPGEQELTFRNVKPSVIDIICYFYCYAGMFTGPYFSFRSWLDGMEGRYCIKRLGICSQSHYCRATILKLLVETALCGGLYITLIKLFPLNYLWSLEWSQANVVRRLLHLIPIFTWFRLRFYSAWLASETALTSLRIGIYPTKSHAEPGIGPTDFASLNQILNTDPDDASQKQTKCYCDTKGECSFWTNDTIHNIAIYECEFSPTVAGKLRAWNRTVQYWLAVNFYKRLPKTVPRPIRALITVLVSAYWHGLHAGYYLSFGTVGLLLPAERVLPTLISYCRSFSPFQSSLPRSPEKPKKDILGFVEKARYYLYEYFIGFWSMRAFEYMAVGFYALTFTDTVRIWQDVFYVQHLVGVFLLAISFIPNRAANINVEHS